MVVLHWNLIAYYAMYCNDVSASALPLPCLCPASALPLPCLCSTHILIFIAIQRTQQTPPVTRRRGRQERPHLTPPYQAPLQLRL